MKVFWRTTHLSVKQNPSDGAPGSGINPGTMISSLRLLPHPEAQAAGELEGTAASNGQRLPFASLALMPAQLLLFFHIRLPYS